MISSMFLLYAVLCWIVFRWLRLVRATTWTVLTAVVIGTFGIGFLVLMMNFYQPYTREARFIFYSTAINAEVNGLVIEVPIQANQPLKKGDVLVRIDPTPFEMRVRGTQAGLALAKRALDFAEEEAKRNQELFEKKVIDPERMDRIRDARDEAADRVKQTEAQLGEIQYQLDHCVIRAPTDGHVAQLLVRPGFKTVPLPFAPLMTFVHAEKEVFIGVFEQNVLRSIDPGDEVEVTFRSAPGYVFHGKVERAAAVIAEGQILASAELQSFTRPQRPGRVPVIITLDSADLAALKLPGGAAGEATIYTGEFKLTELIRRVLLRIQSWKNYLVLP